MRYIWGSAIPRQQLIVTMPESMNRRLSTGGCQECPEGVNCAHSSHPTQAERTAAYPSSAFLSGRSVIRQVRHIGLSACVIGSLSTR